MIHDSDSDRRARRGSAGTFKFSESEQREKVRKALAPAPRHARDTDAVEKRVARLEAELDRMKELLRAKGFDFGPEITPGEAVTE